MCKHFSTSETTRYNFDLDTSILKKNKQSTVKKESFHSKKKVFIAPDMIRKI